jgi:hypothetical protein
MSFLKDSFVSINNYQLAVISEQLAVNNVAIANARL